MKNVTASLAVFLMLIAAGASLAQTVPSWCTGPQCTPGMFNTKGCKNLELSRIELDSGVGWKSKNMRTCDFRIWACGHIWKQTYVPYDQSCPDHSNVHMTRVCCERAGAASSPGCGGVRGLVFLTPQSGEPALHTDPSLTSPVVGRPPAGVRLVYRGVMNANGQTWFHVYPPGATPGWIPGSDASCTRPPPVYQRQPVFECDDGRCGHVVLYGVSHGRGEGIKPP